MERKVDGILVHGMSPGADTRCVWRIGSIRLEWGVGSVSRKTRRLRQIVKEPRSQAKEFRLHTGMSEGTECCFTQGDSVKARTSL